jgi:hypothetical protein
MGFKIENFKQPGKIPDKLEINGENMQMALTFNNSVEISSYT